MRRNLLIGRINQYVKLAFMGQISEVVLHGTYLKLVLRMEAPNIKVFFARFMTMREIQDLSKIQNTE